MRETPAPGRDLAALERLRSRYGGDAADRKLAHLRRLARVTLPTRAQVLRLHEALCFLRAYPDDARILMQVRAMLARFVHRPDFVTHAASLADSGIAGTAIRYRFFWSTVRWLTLCWPERLRLDRTDTDAAQRLTTALPLLAPAATAEWLRGVAADPFEALERLRGRGQATDAVCLAALVEALPGDAFTREAFSDGIDATYALDPGPGGPSRTLAHFGAAPFRFQTGPLRRERPDLRRALAIPPQSVRVLSRRNGTAFINLARSAMVTRARDLMAFEYGSAQKVRLVDDGAGLAFAFCGVLPERRLLLPAVFGGLMLRNGVPLGYVQLDVLGAHAAISFNLFETFRGAEAGFLFARLLATTRHVFGATRFSIEPYQLGQANDEAVESGAWWFYYKLGFRPLDPQVVRLVRAERARLRANPLHRSSARTLLRLADAHLFFEAAPGPLHGLPPVPALLERATRRLASAGGMVAGQSACEALAAQHVGLRAAPRLRRAERLLWHRWAPLLATLPEIGRWTRAERRAVLELVRAKGGPDEVEFLLRFAAHARLRRALVGRDHA